MVRQKPLTSYGSSPSPVTLIDFFRLWVLGGQLPGVLNALPEHTQRL